MHQTSLPVLTPHVCQFRHQDAICIPPIPRLFISVTASNQDTWCVISVLRCLGLPSRIPASEQPLWHQPVINILNKPADGWFLSHSVWKRCSHGGRRDGQQGHGEWMKAPRGNNLNWGVDTDVIHCSVSDWVSLGHLMLLLRHICFSIQIWNRWFQVIVVNLFSPRLHPWRGKYDSSCDRLKAIENN